MQRFSILQQKSLNISTISLCKSMDIVALCTIEGVLSIRRTLSWEKVITINISEMCPSSSLISAMVFSDNGKVLTVGFNDGNISVLDIETSQHVLAYLPALITSVDSITHLCWLEVSKSYNPSKKLTMTERGCQNDDFESSGTDKEDRAADAISKSLKSSILLCFHKSFIVGYLFGFVPVFCLDILPSMMNPIPMRLSSTINFDGRFPSYSISMVGSDFYDSKCNSVVSRSILEVKLFSNLSLLQQNELFCQHISQIQTDIDKVSKAVVIMEKKWKDLNKTVCAKISLLNDLICGYEINMNPIEFLYSVTLCGKWHPAVIAHFSQHWNDQGILRCKSQIESTSKYILRALHQLTPAVLNLILRCKELAELAILQNENSTTSQLLVNVIVISTEQLLFKLDEAQIQARQAREGLLKFIQFVKENTIFPDNPNYASFKFDLKLREDMVELLDPTLPRANTTMIESVCGTHLYAYLRDAELPYFLYQQKTNDSTAVVNREEESIFQLAESYNNNIFKDLSKDYHSTISSSSNSYIIDLVKEELTSKRSLDQQINVIKIIYSHLKNEIMNDLIKMNSLTSKINDESKTDISNILCFDVLKSTGVEIILNDENHKLDSVVLTASAFLEDGVFRIGLVIEENCGVHYCAKLSLAFCPKELQLIHTKDTLILLGIGTSSTDTYFFKIDISEMNFERFSDAGGYNEPLITTILRTSIESTHSIHDVLR